MNPPSPLRPWTRREELANSLSHALAFLAALAAAPFLLRQAAARGPAALAGAAIFAVATIFLYFSSAFFHWSPLGRVKDRFELLDHAGIFFLIAGSYTPFALGVLRGPWGLFLLSVVWPVALAGAVLHLRRGVTSRLFTVSLYVALGWLIVVAARPLLERMPRPGLLLLAAGGGAYTGGLLFYFARRVPYHHLAWHLSCIVGTGFHYVAVWRYAG